MLRFLKLYRVRDFIVDKWQGRFKFGITFVGAAGFANRFSNNNWKFAVQLCQVVSAATGHWPWSVFDFAYITGKRSCFHFGVCGLTIGTRWCPNIGSPNEDGSVEILGPDYRKWYFFFSCINHQNTRLEDM